MPDLFEYTKGFFTKGHNRPDLAFKNSYYVIAMLLASNSKVFYQIYVLTLYMKNLPHWASYYFLHYVLPKMRNPPYLYFTKKTKVKDVELSEKIEKLFNCSAETARQYKIVMEKEGVDLKKTFGL